MALIDALSKFGIKANPTKSNSTNLLVKVAKSKHMTKTCTAFNLKNLKNSSWVNVLDTIKREVGYYRQKRRDVKCVKLSYGEGIAGKGRLTEKVRNILQNYVSTAIRQLKW